jgi:hypothetical protein
MHKTFFYNVKKMHKTEYEPDSSLLQRFTKTALLQYLYTAERTVINDVEGVCFKKHALSDRA